MSKAPGTTGREREELGVKTRGLLRREVAFLQDESDLAAKTARILILYLALLMTGLVTGRVVLTWMI